jgi:hypothetical protein
MSLTVYVVRQYCALAKEQTFVCCCRWSPGWAHTLDIPKRLQIPYCLFLTRPKVSSLNSWWEGPPLDSEYVNKFTTNL